MTEPILMCGNCRRVLRQGLIDKAGTNPCCDLCGGPVLISTGHVVYEDSGRIVIDPPITSRLAGGAGEGEQDG